MTVVPLPRIVRRHKPTELNHSAYRCDICWAGSMEEHRPNCNVVTGPQPADPPEARVFRGLLLAVPLGITGWVLFSAFLIWSH